MIERVQAVLFGFFHSVAAVARPFALAAIIPAAVVFSSHWVFAGTDVKVREGTTRNGRTFTLFEAVQTALRQNPSILTALQEIERTKGLVIEVRADALPRLEANATFQRTDPNLTDFGGGFTTAPGGGGVTPTPTVVPSPTAGPGGERVVASGNSDNTYNLRFEVTQLIYSGSILPAIRGANFSRDISYYQLRDTIDTVISTVRRQFYLVLLNAALINVQEESVQLLESQVRDQQNRFEAGTVPRFNVLRAEVELSNQRPVLIRARNDYRISQLDLARTLGLDYEPGRGGEPLRLVGALQYEPRHMALEAAVALGKERRTFLKERLANVELQRANVGVAAGGYHPTIRASGGYEFQSSPFDSAINEVRSGFTVGATGNWAIWDSGQTYGRVKQARAVLEQAKISYDDAVRQVELEIQQAHSSVEQARELIASQEKNVEQAEESLRLAKARFDAGAGTQLELLDARVALTQARSTKFQAMHDYNAAVAEFDRVTGLDTIFVDPFIDPTELRRRGRLRLRSATTSTTTTTRTTGTSGLSK